MTRRLLRGAFRDVWPKTYRAPTRTCSGDGRRSSAAGRRPTCPARSTGPRRFGPKNPSPVLSAMAKPLPPVGGRQDARAGAGGIACITGRGRGRKDRGRRAGDCPSDRSAAGDGVGVVTTPAGSAAITEGQGGGTRGPQGPALPSPAAPAPRSSQEAALSSAPPCTAHYGTPVTERRWRSLRGL